MKKLAKIILPVLFILGLLSCTVVDNEEALPVDNADNSNTSEILYNPVLITDSLDLVKKIAGDNMKSWTASRFTLSGSTLFTSCRLDDIMTFNRDGSYRYDGGNQLCGAEDNRRVKTGNWTTDFEKKTILFDEGTLKEYNADIIGFYDNKLTLRGTYMSMEVRGEYQAQ